MKKIMMTATLLTAAMACFTANAQPQRLVVSVASDSQQQSMISPYTTGMAQSCHTLPSGANWCIAMAAKRANLRTNQTSMVTGPVSYHSVAVHVPDELTVDEAQALLISSGRYDHVERDIQVRAAQVWNTTTPDDPFFNGQKYFEDNTTQTPAASSVLSMWRKIQAPEKNIDVYVMDGGFRLNDDLSYADGFNFTVVSYDNERGTGFLESDFNAECPDSHGLGVAGVIGAAINNQKGVAGIVGDVTIHPLRVMDCSLGFTTDIAAALDWLNGSSENLRFSSPDLPLFTGNPGVINLSVGGLSDECPVFMQDAINKVREKGFVVVVAAGNETMDVAKSVPANCDGVIAVGSAHADEYNPVDISPFSNFGERITVMAQGQQIAGLSNTDESGSLNGTSFSSPMVAGILAAVQKDFDFTAQEWESLVYISGKDVFSADSNCAQVGCGGGVLDASLLYDNAKRMAAGELNAAGFTLNAMSACRQAWAVKYLVPGQSLCEHVTVSAGLFVKMSERDEIRLLTAAPGTVVSAQDTSAMTLVGEYTSAEFLVSKSDLAERDTYAQQCDMDTGVCTDLVKINTTALGTLPEACQ